MRYKYIVGPIMSRRLGVSLGIDPIPSKTCSFDCLYCEIKKTTDKTIERKEYIAASDILGELKHYLENTNKKLDYITFSGSGEPTLNSKMGYLIKEIKKMTKTKVAVITNSSIIDQKSVRDDLLEADLIVPSLDAVTEKTFKKIDLPHKSIKIENIIQGLIDLRKEYSGQIWLEVLVLKDYNDTESEFNKLNKVIKQINPDKVQINSLDRAPAYSVAKKAEQDVLERLKGILEMEGIDII